MYIFMSEWWELMSNPEKIFWSISIIFSVLFFIQFVLSLFGVGFGDDDGGHDIDDHGYGLDKEFAFLSVRSIIAFFTFFGWTGVLLLSKGNGTFFTVIMAFLSGSAAMLLVAYLMYIFGKLTQSGNADVYEALFTTADVYLPIPERRKGAGRILIKLGGSIREMEAVTEGESIQTGQKVKIVEILDGNTFVVIPVETFEIPTSYDDLVS